MQKDKRRRTSIRDLSLVFCFRVGASAHVVVSLVSVRVLGLCFVGFSFVGVEGCLCVYIVQESGRRGGEGGEVPAFRII